MSECSSYEFYSSNKKWIELQRRCPSLIRHWMRSPVELCYIVLEFLGRQEIQTLRAKEGYISCLVAIDDFTFASGSCGAVIRIWHVESGQCLKSLIGHQNCINALVSINSTIIVGGDHAGEIKIWDIQLGRCIGTLTKEAEPISSVISTGNGSLASANYDGTVKFWDFVAGKCLKIWEKPGGHWPILALLDPETLLIASHHRLQSWNLKSEKCLTSQLDIGIWPRNCVIIDNKHVAIASNPLPLQIIEIGRKEDKYLIRDRVHSCNDPDFTETAKCVILLDKQTLAAGYDDGISLFDIPTAELIYTIPCQDSVTSLVSLDESTFAAGFQDGNIILYGQPWNISQ